MPEKLVTIGVYGFDLDSFLQCLRDAHVERLLDVRQRRAVRGHEYAWANSQRLQTSLADAGIAYEHHLELAPTTALRELQYAADDRQHVGKRSRQELAPEFKSGYVEQILDRADLEPIVSLDGVVALLCVERDAEACHRSLITQRLASQYGIDVEHLHPES